MSEAHQEPRVVRVADADVGHVAALLARAFHEDPLFTWVEPDPARRLGSLAALMAGLTWRSHLYSEAYTTAPARYGASLWKGPGFTPMSPEQLRRAGLDRLPQVMGTAAHARFGAAMASVEAAFDEHAPASYWYLGVLGVDPSARGSGLGGALMEPILSRADREHLPTVLETFQPRNLAYYARHGFATLHHEQPQEGRPAFWVLCRPPRQKRPDRRGPALT